MKELSRKAQALDPLVDLQTYSHLWSQALGRDQGTKSWIQVAEVSHLSLRDKVKCSVILEGLRVFNTEEPHEVAGLSCEEASLDTSLGRWSGHV